MSLTSLQTRELRVVQHSTEFDPETTARIEALGLNPDSLKLRAEHMEVASQAVNYALNLVSAGMDHYYAQPGAGSLARSKIDDSLRESMQFTLNSSDVEVINEAVRSVTHTQAEADQLDRQIENNIGLILKGSSMVAKQAVRGLQVVVATSDREGYNLVRQNFSSLGMVLPELAKEERMTEEIKPTSISHAKANAVRTAVGLAATGAIIAGVAGPAAASEGSPSPSSSASISAQASKIQQGVPAKAPVPASTESSKPAVQPAKQTKSPAPNETPSSTTPASTAPSEASPTKSGSQGSQPTDPNVSESPKSDFSAPGGPADISLPKLSVLPDGRVVLLNPKRENSHSGSQGSETTTPEQDPGPYVRTPSGSVDPGFEIPVPRGSIPAPNKPDVQPTPYHPPVDGSPTPDWPDGLKPSNGEASPTPSPSDPEKTPIPGEGSEESKGPEIEPTTPTAPLPTNPETTPPIEQNPTVPPTDDNNPPEATTPPTDDGSDTPPAKIQTPTGNKTFDQIQQEGAENLAEVDPSIKTPIERITKSAETGKLNDLASGSADPTFAHPDPFHPNKNLPLKMDPETNAEVDAWVKFINGLLAGDTNLADVINEYYSEHPVKGSLTPEQTATINDDTAPDGQGGPDLSVASKSAIALTTQDVLDQLTASAQEQIHAANKAYNKAQQVLRHKAGGDRRGNRQGERDINDSQESNFGNNIFSLRAPEHIDVDKMIKVGQEYIDKVAPNSKMKAWYIVKGALEQGLNPLFFFPMNKVESHFGTDGVSANHNTFNPINRDCPTSQPHVTYRDGVSGWTHHACKYASYEDAFLNHNYLEPLPGGLVSSGSLTQYIKRKYIDEGIENVPDMIDIFTPASESNPSWHKTVLGIYHDDIKLLSEQMGNGISFGNRTDSKLNSSEGGGSDTGENNTESKLAVSDLQTDPRWANVRFNGGTIGDSGCGATAFSNAVNDVMNRTDVTPAMIARKSYSFDGGGLGLVGETLALHLADEFGMKEELLHTDMSKVMASLRNGRKVIISGEGSAPFYEGAGHIVYAFGLTNKGNIRISDSIRGQGYVYSPQTIAKNMKYAVAVYK